MKLQFPSGTTRIYRLSLTGINSLCLIFSSVDIETKSSQANSRDKPQLIPTTMSKDTRQKWNNLPHCASRPVALRCIQRASKIPRCAAREIIGRGFGKFEEACATRMISRTPRPRRCCMHIKCISNSRNGSLTRVFLSHSLSQCPCAYTWNAACHRCTGNDNSFAPACTWDHAVRSRMWNYSNMIRESVFKILGLWNYEDDFTIGNFWELWERAFPKFIAV